jgi:hypothetical protein
MSRDQRSTHLERSRHLHHAEAEPAVALREEHAGPTLLGALRPQRGVEGGVALDQAAHVRDRAFLGEEFPRGVLDRLLRFRKSEVHRRIAQ